MATITRSPAQETQFIAPESRISVEQWAQMPETKPHYELIEGELKRKMSTRRGHTHAIAMLIYFLMTWGYERGWIFNGEGTGTRIDDSNAFVPDFVGFAPGTQLDSNAVYDGPPFLICEVLSRATAANDRNTKMRGYARGRIEMYLIVDVANQTVEVYRLNGDSYGEPQILSSHAVWQPAELDGLQLDLSKLWL